MACDQRYHDRGCAPRSRGSTRSRHERRSGSQSCSASSTSLRACGTCPIRPSRSCSRTAASPRARWPTSGLITLIPWVIKPLYGLLSDFVPLFGRRRQSYFLLTSAVAGLAGLLLAWGNWIATGQIWTFDLFGLTFTVIEGVGLFTVMALGLAFTDVLTDAMMVESGRPLGLTGSFQSVQWACITLASVLVGEIGGQMAETRSLRAALLLAACFPLMSLTMGVSFVRETPARANRAAFLETSRAIWAAVKARDVWVVAGFIFFFWFSPSFGPAFLYYQTDTLEFSQQFIGRLAAVGSVTGVVGALLYAPLSRRVPLKRIMHLSIALGVITTLGYLLYRGPISALIITVVFGALSMIINLAFLDLAAKACPPRVEATFFAALMSVYNLGFSSPRTWGPVSTKWSATNGSCGSRPR